MDNIHQNNEDKVTSAWDISEVPESDNGINNGNKNDSQEKYECKTDPITILMSNSLDNLKLTDMEIDDMSENEYSDVSSPAKSGEYISPTSPIEMLSALSLDSLFNETGSPEYQDSPRSQSDEFWESHDEEDIMNSATEACEFEEQKGETINPQISASNLSYLKKCATSYVPPLCTIDDDIEPEDIKIFSESTTDYFVVPGIEYQINYLRKIQINQQLQQTHMDQDRIIIYLVLEVDYSISHLFFVDDKMIDLINFVYIWYRSIFQKDLEDKIPNFSIKEPTRRNLSKHSVHSTFEKMRIQSETTIHVTLVHKLDKKMRPIRLD